MKIRRYFIKTLIICVFFLAFFFLLTGAAGLAFPKYSFGRLILPIAGGLSQTGRIRELATIEFIRRAWLAWRYFIFVMGLFLFAFGFLWRSLLLEEESESVALNSRFNAYEKPQQTVVFYGFALILLIAIGTVLRIIKLDISFFCDEIAMLQVYIRPFKLWRYVSPSGLGDHRLCSIISYLVIKFFGESEVVVRLPFFLLGIAAIPAIYAFGKAFFSKKTGLLGATLLTFSMFHIFYSNQVRGYTGLALFSLSSSFVFFKIIYPGFAMPAKKHYFLLSLLTFLGMLVHFYYTVVLTIQLVTLAGLFALNQQVQGRVLRAGNRAINNSITAIIGGLLAAFIILGPLFFKELIWQFLYGMTWGSPISFFGFLSAIATGSPVFINSLIYLGLFFLGLANLVRSGRKVMALYFFSLVIIPLALAQVILRQAVERYFIFILPFLILAVAGGIILIADIFQSRLRRIVLALLTIFLISLQLSALVNYYSQPALEDYRGAALLIDKSAASGDIVYAIGIAAVKAQYYLRRHKIIVPAEREFFEQLARGKSTAWVIVTFPEFMDFDLASGKIYEFARQKFNLAGHFPGHLSDIRVYKSRKNATD